MSNQRLKSDHIIGLGGLGQRGFGLPSTSKFESGYMPSGVMPVSRAIHVIGGNDDRGDSDMDTGSDSDDEVYGVRYSLEHSPQDDKIPNGFSNGHAGNAGGPVFLKFNSSENISDRRQIKQLDTKKGRVGKCADKDLLDSIASSDVNSSAFWSYQSGCSVTHQLKKNAEAHNSSVPFKREFKSQGQNEKFPDGDMPSAPPLDRPVQEINQVTERIAISRKDKSYSCSPTSGGSATMDILNSCKSTQQSAAVDRTSDPANRIRSVSHHSLPARFPTFRASGLGPWYAFIAYDACVRLCLHSWARDCHDEATIFLDNECALLRDAFGLKQVLLQPEEELLKKTSSDLVTEGATVKPKQTFGKMKVQVRKVKMLLDPPSGCSLSSLKQPMEKLEPLRLRLSNVKSVISSEWKGLRKIRRSRNVPGNGSISQRGLVYMHAGARYIKEVSELMKIGITTLKENPPSYEVVQETYFCSLRLKSSSEEDAVKVQPGSGETHVFLPDGLADSLVIEVHDSKGKYYGRVVAQVAEIADDPGDKLRWWPIYHEPDHELVGRIQLFINYSTSPDGSAHLKCGFVAETVAYDFVLEAAMKVEQFQQRNLLLHGPWSWLVTEFASYYGVSDTYAKLRYLSYVMDVATPTADCLELVHNLLLPVILKSRTKHALSHQENRILGEVSDQIEEIIALVFENYKSLDESSPSGIADVIKPATGVAAPALSPALKLYMLLHDILSSEAQLKLCRYFQTAAKKRSKRHLTETEEFVSYNNENTLLDQVAFSTAYKKMKSLCLNYRNEVATDLEIHHQHVLPSFIDLPNVSSSIYSSELSTILRTFLVGCPPTGPSRPVVELVITTADFQKDLASWNIDSVKGGVDAKELFHLYITLWIQDKRHSLLEFCKLDKLQVNWSGFQNQHSTTPFIDDIYDRLKETLKEYEVIISRWPEYSLSLESAVGDVENAVVDTLEKQYANVLSPLKENAMPIKIGLKYVHKLAKGGICAYSVPCELGILLNSMKRILDVLGPQIESQFKSWSSFVPDSGNVVSGERLSEVRVMLRTKFRNYLQATMDKLVENTRLQNATKLKKIIQDTKEIVTESDIRSRMEPLKDLLESMINQLHNTFDTQVFIIICRGLWERMGQDVLRFLEDKKENKSWYKASRIAVSILDDIFASHMQQLIGNMLQEKDLEPPRSMLEVRSILCKDSVNHNDNNYFY